MAPTPSDPPSEPSSLTRRLSIFIAYTDLSNIPAPIIQRAKYLILDGVACGLVNSHLPWSETAAHGILKMKPEDKGGQCAILGWGGCKRPPVVATVLDSAFIQGFELDGYYSNALLLPALPAAAQAEPSGRKSSCVELLKAYIVGCEVRPRWVWR